MDEPRARLGVILPSNNTVFERDACHVLPEGVSTHVTRIPSRGISVADLVEMEANAGAAADELGRLRLDLLLYACVSTSLAKGDGWDERFTDDVRSRTRLGCETAARATVRALAALGVTRIAVAHPYPAEIATLLLGYLERHGLRVVSSRALDASDGKDVCDRDAREAYALARSAWTPDADAICVMATDFSAVEVIAALESDLGVPVVTANQALLWSALRDLGRRDAVTGYGRLFAVP